MSSEPQRPAELAPAAAFEPGPDEDYEPMGAPAAEAEETYETALHETAAHEPAPPEAAAPEPIDQEPFQEEPVAQPPAKPAWKMEPVELPPDLVLVETRPDATTEVTQAPEEERRPVRQPRPQTEEPASGEEVLVQVETRKDTEPANSNPG
ncbi:MAG: hypothetical protein ACREU7_16270 [Burkholderiales bacterium]